MSNSKPTPNVIDVLQKFMIGGIKRAEPSAIQAQEIMEARTDREEIMTLILSTIPNLVCQCEIIKPIYIAQMLPKRDIIDVLDPCTMFVGSKVWDQIVTSPDFTNIVDPEVRYTRVMAGYLGTMYGMAMITNAQDVLGKEDALANTLFLATTVHRQAYVAKLIVGT